MNVPEAAVDPRPGTLPDTTQRVALPGGSYLLAESYGDSSLPTLLWEHGMPGSQHLAYGIDRVLSLCRVLTYARPGYGGSDRIEGYRLADSAYHVATVADAFKVSEFGLVGVSAGGRHALACAAGLPERVKWVLLGSSAAPCPEREEGFRDMAPSNAFMLRGPEAEVIADIESRAEKILARPNSLGESLAAELPESDLKILGNLAMRELRVASLAEAVRQGAGGWIDDVMLARNTDMGFDPGRVTAPVREWHGGKDTLTPVGLTTSMLLQLVNAPRKVTIQSDAGHYGQVLVLPNLIKEMLERYG